MYRNTNYIKAHSKPPKQIYKNNI